MRNRITRHQQRSLLTVGAMGTIVVLGLAACAEDPATDRPGVIEESSTEVQASAGEDCRVVEFTKGVQWQQQAAEARALQQQTYTQAEEELKKLLAAYENSPEGSGEYRKSPAIITDLDETVIDNTSLLARDLENCHDYSDWSTWGHWEKEGTPRLIPGALAFLRAADEMGVQINYISDRQEENLEPTLATLRSLGLPQLDTDGDSGEAAPKNLLLLGPPKEERRQKVRDQHHILMQLGDTLHDFDPRFADTDLEQQQKLVEENADRFGREWIILPNAAYGSWEDAELDAWGAPIETGDYK